MVIVVTLLLSFFILFILFIVFFKLKTPHYRISRQQMIDTVEKVLTGQATDNNWQMTFGMTVRHSPELEMIRQQCVAIEEQFFIGNQKPPYLFSEQGLVQLRIILSELKMH